MRVAIYTRVSTGKQEYENQLNQLRDYCKSKDWDIFEEYNEKVSGKERNRPEFVRMMDHAAKRKFDVILVWALDRFTREGTERVWHYISLLNSYGVKFVSYQEPFFNTDNEMVRDILLSVMGTLAKQERIRLGLRTKAGLERAKKQGKKIGRPGISSYHKKRIIELHNLGESINKISKQINLSYGTVWGVIKKP